MFRNLGPTLKHLRERGGKSQAAVARKAGVGKSQLSKYEHGKELPKLESLERVLVALGVGYFDFFWTLDVIDRGESDKSPVIRGAIDERFTKLTQAVFALHREIVKELPDG